MIVRVEVCVNNIRADKIILAHYNDLWIIVIYILGRLHCLFDQSEYLFFNMKLHHLLYYCSKCCLFQGAALLSRNNLRGSIFIFDLSSCRMWLGTEHDLCKVLYRVSQEECARLREGVPYVKVYRYNPKHLWPKLNGYGDNGQRKLWSSCGSTHCTCHLTIPVLACGVILQQVSKR